LFSRFGVRWFTPPFFEGIRDEGDLLIAIEVLEQEPAALINALRIHAQDTHGTISWVCRQAVRAELRGPRNIGQRTETKRRRSTTNGDAQESIQAALRVHHEYDEGCCGNFEPVRVTELSELAKVSKSTASGFLKDQFGGHREYKGACSRQSQLNTVMRRISEDQADRSTWNSVGNDIDQVPDYR
jgi:hypothetical protein